MANKGQKFKYQEEQLIYQIVQEKLAGKPYSYLEIKDAFEEGKEIYGIRRIKKALLIKTG